MSAGKGKEKVEAPAAAGGVRGRFVAYPPRMAEHKDVVADAAIFRAALERLHAHMGTKLNWEIKMGGEKEGRGEAAILMTDDANACIYLHPDAFGLTNQPMPPLKLCGLNMPTWLGSKNSLIPIA